MSQAEAFLNLLKELRDSGSIKRMKLLSELWRLASSMSREERTRLAVEVGIEGGESVLENFLSSPGSNTAELLRWSDEVFRSVNLDALEPHVSEKLGRRKGETVVSALKIAQSRLQHEDDAQPSPSEPPPVPAPLKRAEESDADESPSDDPMTISDSILPEEVGPRTSLGDVLSDEDSESGTQPSISDHVPFKAVTPVVEDGPPRRWPSKPSTAATGSIPTTESAAPSQAVTPDRPSPISHWKTHSKTVAGLLQELRDHDSPVRRFRVLREQKELPSLTVPNAQELLELFAPAWMRRKILIRLLEGPLNDDFSVVAHLISSQSRTSTDFVWFCSALIKRLGSLEPGQLDLLQNHAPSPAAWKRVARRLP